MLCATCSLLIFSLSYLLHSLGHTGIQLWPVSHKTFCLPLFKKGGQILQTRLHLSLHYSICSAQMANSSFHKKHIVQKLTLAILSVLN